MIRGLREILPDNGKAFSSILISLKTRNFRLYFTGMCVSLTGTWMQQIAMSWLVYRLTGSVFLLATVTFMAQIPILLVTPLMSVFVDRFDRQKILILTQSLSMVQALSMAVLTLSGVIEVWHILILSLLIGCINPSSLLSEFGSQRTSQQCHRAQFGCDQWFPAHRPGSRRSTDRNLR